MTDIAQNSPVTPPLSDADRLLLDQWNTSAAPIPGGSLHEIITAVARRTPQAIAVTCEQGALTYQQLDERADALMTRLLARGVGPGTIVGLCLDRDLALLPTLLATLKTGAAFLPLDPELPADRFVHMVVDSETPLIVTQRHLRERIPECGRALFVPEDDDADPPARATREPVPVPVNAAAYMLYTSGSTGKPKGIVVPHRALANTLSAFARLLDLQPAHSFFALTTTSFDIAYLELFGPLLAGARVELAPARVRHDPLLLGRWIDRTQPTFVQATPSTWRMLLDTGWSSSGSDRTVLVGGEALLPDLARALRTRARRVLNVYGPTETTIWSTAYQLAGDEDVVPIGTPIANTEIYVVGPDGGRVAIGAPGELLLGGESVAIGYWRRPELTAEKFIPDLFSGRPGARLYRTGDLAVIRRDGQLMFQGRIDRQVKIRGHRIELGEIESVFLEHQQVRRCVVTLADADKAHPRLIAYVVPAATGSQDAGLEHASQWQAIWDETYASSTDKNTTIDAVGWNSSYTGQPLPAHEMREWVDCTVERILSLRPKRVLEIGCGTGMLLFGIAPHVEHYHATDVSPVALAGLADKLARPEHRQLAVTLERRSADDLNHVKAESYDLVIANSVLLYFPDFDYLSRFLRGALASLRPGGQLFLGDMLSRPLRSAFFASIILAQPGSQTRPRSELQALLSLRLERDESMLVDPELFLALQPQWPELAEIEVLLKRGSAHNEISGFRHDIIVHKAGGAAGLVGQVPGDAPSWDAGAPGTTLESLARRLEQTQPALVTLRNIPNQRIAAALLAEQALQTGSEEYPLASYDQLLAQATTGIDPEALAKAAEALGYRVALQVCADRRGFDATLARAPGVTTRLPAAWRPAGVRVSRPPASYVHQPRGPSGSASLRRELRDFVATRLPSAMVPAQIVFLDDLPLTPSGKVDLQRLPTPPLGEVQTATRPYEAPRSELEVAIAGLWAEALGIERVGVKDSFLDLGGHSLTATRIVSRLVRTLEVELSIRDLFQDETVENLARRLENKLVEQIAEMSDDDVTAGS